jgi:hypothetical protein
MVDNNASYTSYAISEGPEPDGDRLPVGAAMLAVLGLSLLGWGFVLLPLVAIFHY